MKKQNGITLIALIITIIVMLILVGVSVTVALNGGLINTAEQAAKRYSDEQIKERIKFAFIEYQAGILIEDDIDFYSFMQERLEETFGMNNCNIERMGKNLKIEITGRDEFYILKNDGTIREFEKREEIDSTSIYAKLDDNGNLYLRATEIEGYNTYINSDSIQSNWNTANNATKQSVTKVIIEEPIVPTTMAHMFSGYTNLTEIQNIKNIYTHKVTSMSETFCNCTNLSSLDLSSFDTARVTAMNGMFGYCSSLNSVDLLSFNTKNVINMNGMFLGCTALSSIDVTGFDTRNVNRMYQMFTNCGNLTTLDVSGFDVSKVATMYGMFLNCTNLSSIDVSGFNWGVSAVLDGMFGNCVSLKNIDVSSWNTSKVADMGYLFNGCGGLTNIDLSSFNTSNTTRFRKMFSGCTNLKNLNLGNTFEISDGANVSDMFENNPINIKIKAIEDTAGIIIDNSSLTIDNFDIIE